MFLYLMLFYINDIEYFYNVYEFFIYLQLCNKYVIILHQVNF